MYGRFTRHYTWAQIRAMYGVLPSTSNLQPRYNVCPTTEIDAITGTPDGIEMRVMRWGIIPAWWTKPSKEMKLATFNARAESVDTKPFFRGAWKAKRRCIIPVSGYYEWQDTPKGKQPWYFTAWNGDPILSVAGLWETWRDKSTGQVVESCAMIITEPNAFVAEVHDRMPVILSADAFTSWLDGDANKEALRPASNDVLQKVAVSKKVNSSRADDNDSSLIEAVGISSNLPDALEPTLL